MELILNGNIIKKAFIKSDKGEIRYKIIETKAESVAEFCGNNDVPVFGILKTHVNQEQNEVLDFFDYKTKGDAESEVENACREAEKTGAEVIREILSGADVAQELKHYVFSDESKAITYEDDYGTIEEAQAFNDLLIKQFGKKFTFMEQL